MMDLNLSNAKKDPENKQLLKMADKFINIDDLSIDLIDQVNPFQSAYEVISRDVDSKTLQLIERAFDAKKYEFTNDELRMLYPQIKAFKAEFSEPKEPLKIERTALYYALVTLARLRQEKSS